MKNNQEPTRECCECKKEKYRPGDLSQVGIEVCMGECHSIKPHPLTELLNNKEKMLEIGRKASEDQQEVIDSIKPPEKEYGKKLSNPRYPSENIVAESICHSKQELSPELSWEDTLREIVYRNWKNGDEVGLYEEVKQAFNSGRASMVEVIEGMKREVPPDDEILTIPVKEARVLMGDLAFNSILDDILQALKNKETKE